MLRLFCFSIFCLIFLFGILLIFASFLQAYYDIYFSHILSFSFYILQISFYIYILLTLLIFLYLFRSNLLLYLILFLCFFENKLYYSFLYNAPFLSIKLELVIKILLYVFSYTENKFCIHFFKHEQ